MQKGGEDSQSTKNTAVSAVFFVLGMIEESRHRKCGALAAFFCVWVGEEGGGC